MKNPHEYLDEIRVNMDKIRAQGQVTPTDNALFGMIDGLGGLLRTTMARVAALEQRMIELHGSAGVTHPASRDLPSPQPTQRSA